MEACKEIIFEELQGIGGAIGLVTLNRPEALNALSYEMIYALKEQLIIWEEVFYIKAVLVRSTMDSIFSVGGDIKKVYEVKQTGEADLARFFRDEYQMNAHIHHYKKPYISFLNGLTMGGGVGITLHGSHRIAAENFQFSMPEVGIGFFPDIGSSYLLSRCPGETGIYLGLTGNRINTTDSLSLGLVDYHLRAEDFDELLSDLCNTDFGDNEHETINNVINKYKLPPIPAPIESVRKKIDSLFSKNTMEKIILALQAHSDEWAVGILRTLETHSPSSLKITLKAIQEAKSLNFDDCIKMEYRITNRLLEQHDFFEGIRALLVDKDKNPDWVPNSLQAVSDQQIDTYFEELDDAELPL